MNVPSFHHAHQNFLSGIHLWLFEVEIINLRAYNFIPKSRHRHDSMSSSFPQGTQVLEASDTIFDKAVVQFKKRIHKKHLEKFTQCTLDDVRSQIKDIEDRYGSQRRLRHMNRLSKFVEGMTQLGQVVEMFLNVHNGVAFIWGPIKFLLLVASTWMDSLDSLLEVYGRIGEILPNLRRYDEVYKNYPSIHTHLEAYYCDILELHSNALDVFSRPGWKNIFLSAWKTFNTKFQPILKSLERHRVMLSEEKLTVIMEETQKQGQSIEDKLDRLDRDLKKRDRKNIERDLVAHQDYFNQQRRIVESKIDAPDYHHDHDIASQKRHRSAPGNWILGHPLLLEWFDISSVVNRKIYLSGIPGAGKTVLTSRLISHLEQRRLNSKNSGEKFSTAYFYFKHMQPEKRSLISLLLSLLSQLTAQDESLLDHVYQSCCTTERQRLRSLDEISHLVSTALQSQSICFVVVDGLDECPEAPKVLEWFENLMSSWVSDPSGSSESCIRLFISGQRDGVLEKQMAEYPSIQLETTMGHDQDIGAFTMAVAEEIRAKFSLDSEVEQEIVSRVTSRARGMFLYARLVVSNLLSQTSRYERIVHRVLRNPKKTERDAAKQLLGMIMCACRPLRWREIQSKFCIDASKGEVDLDRQLLITCKQLCGSLVEASYLDPTISSTYEEVVDLVHSTAKAYLIEKKEISMAAENAKMALFCAEYLLSRPLTPGISKLEIQKHATKGYYGFQDYAVAFWWQHAQQVLAASGLEAELGQRALQAVHRAMVDIGELEQDEGPHDSPLSNLALKNKLGRVPQDSRDWKSIKLCEIRTAVIREVIDSLLHQPDNAGHTGVPLYGPWRYKCPKAWCQYFSSGFEEPQHRQAHINQHDLPFLCDFQGCRAAEVGFGTETDLKRHTVRWHPKEEKLLFPTPKQHTSVRQQDIVKAAEKGDLDSIKYLVEQGYVNPSHWKKHTFRTPLHAAAEYGHLHVVQYLTQKGAAVDAKTNASQTALHKAVARRDLEITTFLCDLDRVTLLKDMHGRTALDDAVCDNQFNKAIVAQLLRKATPDVLENALLLAIRSKKVMAVRYLAENIDVRYLNEFKSALEVAVRTEHLPCIDALLSSGKADANVRNSAGALPLHVACQVGSLPTVQRLHALTTTPDLKDLEGKSLLHLAIAHRHEGVALWILQNGVCEADINASDKDGQTPLILAFKNGYEEVAKVLIKKTANLEDHNGDSLFHWAIANGLEAVVSWVLQKAADCVDINGSDKGGHTPLMLALRNGGGEVAKLLIENGANVNASGRDGQTPLMLALKNGNEGAVKVLIENRSNIDISEKDGQTPLMLALRNSLEAAARLLIENGADINVRYTRGWTPLLLASGKGYEAVVKALIEKGADVNIRSENGQTPLSLATSFGHEAVAMLLVENGADDI
ncbi:hypothetical protein FDECE_14621 [Fusarium decemcellulare]|nr:hypothetical protein FDECE_14621 [Fusarium decemcellulare]